MKNTADRSLMLIAVVVALLLAVGTFFLGINPRLSAASDARAARDSQLAENVDLEAMRQQRIAAEANVPEMTDVIYEIRDMLPPSLDAPQLRRSIAAIINEAGLVVHDDIAGDPVPVLGGLVLAPAMQAVGLQSVVDGKTFSTLYAIPYSFTVRGNAIEVLDVLEEIQLNVEPYYLISSVAFSATDSEGAGAVSVTVIGSFFMLDAGVPDIAVREPERPWPGSTEGGDSGPLVNPFILSGGSAVG